LNNDHFISEELEAHLFGYRRRIERDLERWQARGWVTPDGAVAIRNELARGGGGFGLAGVLGTLAAVLLGFAAMSFVAANWDGMPRLVRLAILVGALWAAYGAGGWLRLAGHQRLTDGAVLAGSAFFGAAIMLVAQMYHIEGNPPDAVLLWTGGALVAGLLFASPPSLVLAMALLVLWTNWTSSLTGTAHFAFLPAWAATAAAFGWLRWRPGLHVGALALMSWTSSLGYLLFKGHAFVLVTGIGLALSLLFGVCGPAIDRIRRISEASLGYSVALLFSGLLGWQFVERVPNGTILLVALATFAVLAVLYLWASRRNMRAVLWIGYVAFSLEVIGLYFKTIGTLLGTSLFFLVMGLLFALLAFLALKLHRAHSPAAPGTGNLP
jgi:uncharacterized membrane protein